MSLSIEFRVLDFNIRNHAEQEPPEETEEDDTGRKTHKRPNVAPRKTSKDLNIFEIQIFGINEVGETYSVVIEGFCPFFYVMVNDTWDSKKQSEFLHHIQVKMGPFYKNTITECFLIKRRKLYGFDGEKEHKFIKLSFTSVSALNKAKNLWYSEYLPNGKGHYLLREGYVFKETNTRLYEANIPPLLRFLHINEISPSGWVSLPTEKVRVGCETTTCKYEFIVNVRDITPLNEKETRVPYKICSFDIEASSSHGDFPVPVKSYNKLVTNIIEYLENHDIKVVTPDLLRTFIHAAFSHAIVNGIELVYPMFVPTKAALDTLVDKWLQVRQITETSSFQNLTLIQDMFEKYKHDDEPEEENAATAVVTEVVDGYVPQAKKLVKSRGLSVIEIIMSSSIVREEKIRLLDISMWTEEMPLFPQLEGDKVTFIGSTFTKYGSQEPYLNHCAVLNTCDELPMENTVIESFRTEKEVLLAWQRLIQREDPDIIIGYNIFGFDYTFMFKRAEQTDCVDEFLKLSRNRDEICATQDPLTMKYKLEESAIKLASGQHDLKFAKISGRLQVDLYNFFRREENLNSYKLDYVAGYFIGDYVKTLTHKELTNESEIKTINMTGLLVGSYVHFEEIGHSTEYYAEGAKFIVTEVNKLACSFRIGGQIHPDFTKKVRWCLAKDDVTPKDIFRMSNGTSADRSIIAKYCIQDCNLVHYLFNKVDILTGFIEMAKICSVPINFLVMRGQGIKLTSYIAKKCREKRTLMPVIEKGSMDDGYEGAIVLDPKCDLYLDNPVACVDFASLYPSCIVSENLSHDSKVWTKEYDSSGNLDKVEGEQDAEGNFIYDNLPGYEYVDIEYDTYVYVRRVPSAAAEKVRKGYKICRYAQFPDGKRAIMPSIVEELLGARKATRKLIPLQTDEFMKNVLDKRQLGYKVTANSLYGQCGAKTSTFYEMDIAAATTSTGRKLLTYAKKVIEECYGDSVCETAHHGPVLTKAEYIYGDSVANYTPVYVKKEGFIDICTIDEIASRYGKNLWVQCLEPGKQEKEVCELMGLETWSEKGWTKLHRVIRHQLASHKKMVRILTHTGIVDVTDDHSLLLPDGKEISPTDIQIGTELLHHDLPGQTIIDSYISANEARIMGFFFGDGSCGEYDCPSGRKSTWALNNASTDIINKYLELCQEVYPAFDWVVRPTLESSGVYKITPRHNETSGYGSIAEFVREYRKKLYFQKSKIIPSEILNGNKETQQAFFEGLYDADGDKDLSGYTRIDQKNQISASHICYLASSLGWSISLNTRNDKPDIYRVTMTKSKQRKNPFATKKIIKIPYEGYVYDLTTENHHFAAGIGKIIVHNTDSVFFTFNLQTPDGIPIRGKQALEITIELAQEAGHLASSFLKCPHDLEYEKTFMPFCLLSKKRYVGMLYETDPEKCKRKEMGIVLKRRDNAPIVKDIYGGIIDILMKEQNLEKATAFLKSSLKRLVDEQVPMEKLIITKSIRSGYKNPKSIAHKVLADRIMEREPGNKISSGDRVPFVYVHSSNKRALQGEKIETPSFIIEKKLKIDYSFYITNQIMKPVQQVFALVIEELWKKQGKQPKLLSFKKEVKALREATDPDKFEEKLEQLKNKEVKTLLFDSYLRETTNKKEGNQSVLQFSVKK